MPEPVSPAIYWPEINSEEWWLKKSLTMPEMMDLILRSMLHLQWAPNIGRVMIRCVPYGTGSGLGQLRTYPIIGPDRLHLTDRLSLLMH